MLVVFPIALKNLGPCGWAIQTEHDGDIFIAEHVLVPSRVHEAMEDGEVIDVIVERDRAGHLHFVSPEYLDDGELEDMILAYNSLEE